MEELVRSRKEIKEGTDFRRKQQGGVEGTSCGDKNSNCAGRERD
jgi:hypothetical protein